MTEWDGVRGSGAAEWHVTYYRPDDVAWFWSQVAQAALAQLADALLVNEYSTSLEAYMAAPFVPGGYWP
jgi:hypothetical protein